MREDELDDTIRELARRSYNAPPEPPRDELWQRIRAELATRRAGTVPPAVDAAEPNDPSNVTAPPVASRAGHVPAAAPEPTGAPDVIDLDARRRQLRRWTLRSLPIAALLLLSFGLGRLSRFWDGTTTRPVAAGRQPMEPQTHPGATAGAIAPAAAAPESLAAASPAPGTSAGALAAAASPRLLADRTGGSTAVGRTGARSALYRLAAQQTLGQAEMLLTSFRAEARAGGTIDPQVTAWAGDVLSNTRLLLDSPAARDPRLRGLLEDLELVLAQIVQVGAAPGDSASGDTDLIDHALQQRDLMLRLRTAVPAGVTVGT